MILQSRWILKRLHQMLILRVCVRCECVCLCVCVSRVGQLVVMQRHTALSATSMERQV